MSGPFMIWVVLGVVDVSTEAQRLLVELGSTQSGYGKLRNLLRLRWIVCHLNEWAFQNQ